MAMNLLKNSISKLDLYQKRAQIVLCFVICSLFSFSAVASKAPLCSKQFGSPFFKLLSKKHNPELSYKAREILEQNRLYLSQQKAGLEKLSSQLDAFEKQKLPREAQEFTKSLREEIDFLSARNSELESLLKSRKIKSLSIKKVKHNIYSSFELTANLIDSVNSLLTTSLDSTLKLLVDHSEFVDRKNHLKSEYQKYTYESNSVGLNLTASVTDRHQGTSYRTQLLALSRWSFVLLVPLGPLTVHGEAQARPSSAFTRHDLDHAFIITNKLSHMIHQEFGGRKMLIPKAKYEFIRERTRKLGEYLIESFDAHPQKDLLYMLSHALFFEIGALYSKKSTIELIQYIRLEEQSEYPVIGRLIEGKFMGSNKDRALYQKGELDIFGGLDLMEEIVKAYKP